MRRSLKLRSLLWTALGIGFVTACASDVYVGTRSDGVVVYCNVGEYYYLCTPDYPELTDGDDSTTGGGGDTNCNPDTYACPDDSGSGGGSGSNDGGDGSGSGSDDGDGGGGGGGDGSGGGGGDGSGSGSGSDSGSGSGSGSGSTPPGCGPDTFPCDDGSGGGGGGGGDGDGDGGGDQCQPWPLGSATVLWPPNHKMHTYTLADCAKVEVCPNGQAIADGTVTKITVDEEVDVGKGGDGHTTNYDVSILDATHFELRSERQGGMDGRVYTVYYVDGNGAEGSCQFLVPHNKGPHEGAVDSGTKVTVTP